MKKIFILLSILAIACFVTSNTSASIFSVNGGFGTSSVGVGGDYASLYDASTDYDQYAPGQTGDWTVVILNSLTEYSTIAFGNISNGHTFTLKPATSGIVVTLNNTGSATLGPVANTGTPGNLIFGVNNFSDSNENCDNVDIMTSMNNVVLDGSHNGTSSQDLTITCINVPGVTDYSVAIYGSFTNFTVRNMIINYSCPIKFDDAMVVESIYGNNNQGAYPSGGVFLNDTFSAGTNGLGFLASDFFVTTPFPTGATNGNMVFNGCTFQGDNGVELNFIANFTLTNCTIICTSPIGENTQNFGVECINSNKATGWTGNVTNNVFSELSTATAASPTKWYGIRGLLLGGTGGTYNVNNNVITGFNWATPAATGYELLDGIVCAATTSNYNIYNNSIYMGNQTAITGTESPDSCSGISIGTSGTSAIIGVTVNIENNIVEMFQPGGSALQIWTTPAVGGVINSNYNDLVAASVIGRYNGTSYATLANWQASPLSPDAGSQNVDVTATTPAKWATPQTSLQFTPSNSLAGSLFGVNQVGGVTTDITGASRGSPTWPGAYDNGGGITVPVELSRFNIVE